MNDTKVKQQIAEKIKSSSNILVTVSKDPSVDALSAAIGLTVMLNKLGKHATAVFSGAIPPAITFLDPEKTFESTVDSLRDFIIALDKEKADHLRYKVDGDVVKIFITPYRTTISDADLEFSQGDYNVELVLALGVDNQDHLDNALEAHGRILHDATVATISSGDQTSDLGSLSWHDDQASSLSEMLVSLSDSIKDDKPLLDAETATAFLTGIVASTDRFSNPHTTSKVMTIAAQLMAAGADQQLIAAKLQEGHEVSPSAPLDGGQDIPEGSSVKLEDKSAKKSADGELDITHQEGGSFETLDQIAQEVAEKNQQEAAVEAEHELAEQPKPEEVEMPAPTIPSQGWSANHDEEPMLGGTLNATTEQAAEDARRAIEDDQNKTILTHSYLGGSQPIMDTPAINSASDTEQESANDVDIFGDKPSEGNSVEEPVDQKAQTIEEPASVPDFGLASSFTPPTPPTPGQTLADLDAQTRNATAQEHDAAREAVEQALGQISTVNPIPTPSSEPFVPTPAPTPEAPFDLPPPPPLPDFSTLPPPIEPPVIGELNPAYALEPEDTPEILGDILAPEPPAPVPVAPPVPPAPANNDPGQFKIPGQ